MSRVVEGVMMEIDSKSVMDLDPWPDGTTARPFPSGKLAGSETIDE